MNLKDEKFLAGLKAAIESGYITGAIYEPNIYEEIDFHTFDSDESLSAVVKFLEEQPPWIPIEEFELVDGENYDTFSIEYGRMPDCKWNGIYFEGRFLRPQLEKQQVTHIMKRPANPEI